MQIFIGADHRGFLLKESLVSELPGIEDLGIDQETYQKLPVDYQSERGSIKSRSSSSRSSEDRRFPKEADYPIIAEKVAKAVLESNGRGVLLCGSGQGACIAANKIDGIRAAQAWNEETARSARHDDDANILCLAADELETKQALKLINIFLKATFDSTPRRLRRLKEIKKLEENN